MQRHAILAFDVPQSRADLRELLIRAEGMGFISWFDPYPEVDYVLTEEDLLHIAVEYHTTPDAAPARLLGFVFLDATSWTESRLSPEFAEVQRRVDVAWERFVRNHGVGRISEDVATRVKDQTQVENGLEITFTRNPHLAPPSEPGWVPQYRRYRSQPLNLPAQQASARRLRERLEQRLNNTRNPCAEIALPTTYEVIPPPPTPAQPAWVPDWTSDSLWTCPGPDGQLVVWPISSMSVKHLWETICWLINNIVMLYAQANPCRGPLEEAVYLSSCRWLARQTAFRAMVREAIQRRVTFPQKVYRYLMDYVIDRRTEEISVTQPWNDPARSHEVDDMQRFLSRPVDVSHEIDYVQDFGREFRSIDFSS